MIPGVRRGALRVPGSPDGQERAGPHHHHGLRAQHAQLLPHVPQPPLQLKPGRDPALGHRIHHLQPVPRRLHRLHPRLLRQLLQHTGQCTLDEVYYTCIVKKT